MRREKRDDRQETCKIAIPVPIGYKTKLIIFFC